MALLRGSFTDEEPEGTEILFKKREKQQMHFSFSINEISTPLAVVSIFQY
jgi:hypothetical protein